VGRGHVYQGRFKSFPVEEDEYYYQVLRHIERNALRAALVERAEDWRWSSLSRWRCSEPDETWPLARPLPCGPGWSDHVNQPQTEGEFEAIQRAIRRSAPPGKPALGRSDRATPGAGVDASTTRPPETASGQCYPGFLDFPVYAPVPFADPVPFAGPCWSEAAVCDGLLSSRTTDFLVRRGTR
jgi:hypothetical protein